MPKESLTVFYDGYCPLCVKEMASLAARDKQHKLDLVDVHQTEFTQWYPEITPEAALTILHGYLHNDKERKLVTGLDVTCHAWRLVGKGWLVAPLRWPVLRWFCDKAYLCFARHRFTLSKWLTGKSRCQRCQPFHWQKTDD